MKTLFFSFVLFFVFTTYSLKAQNIIENKTPKLEMDKLTFGLGMGLDYGGFGGNLLVYPIENIGLFGGVGYAMAGVGYNFGTKIRIISKKQSGVNFYLQGMYGYNAAIAVSGASQYNKIFYGPSFGIGIDTRYRPMSSGYWSVGLLLPIRGTAVDDYMNDLQKNHSIEFKNKLLPVQISIGYRLNLM